MKISGETKLLLVMAAFVVIGGGTLIGMNLMGGGEKPILPSPASPTPTPAPRAWTKEDFDTLVKSSRYERGDANAPFTIVEFGDFECHPCRVAYNGTISKWDAEKKPIRLIFRHYPWSFHPTAMPAALAAEAAGKQKKFWPMYDALYNGEETPLTNDYIVSCAQKVGLDMAQFERDRKDAATEAIVEKDEAIGKRYGVNSTPTFVVRDKSGNIVAVDHIATLTDILAGKKVSAAAPAPPGP